MANGADLDNRFACLETESPDNLVDVCLVDQIILPKGPFRVHKLEPLGGLRITGDLDVLTKPGH